MSEIRKYTPSEVQNKLWGRIIGENTFGRVNKDGQPIETRLTKRVLQARNGYTPDGLTMEEMSEQGNKFLDILGPLSPRVLIATSPTNNSSLVPEDVVAAGGWCALRTRDVQQMSDQGTIMDPSTSNLDKITSVDQVARWIKRSVALDQVVESIGPINASEYVAISESDLWTERAIAKIENILGKISSDDKQEIAKAIDIAEQIKYALTERYLQFVTQNPTLKLTRVIDSDIKKELKETRDQLLESAGLSLEKLTESDPTVPEASLVWSMYSQPYFDMLRRKGYISKPNVLIVEPAFHAYPETPVHEQVARNVYQKTGKYFTDGLNNQTGFVAFLECLTSKGNTARRGLLIGEVPNISNWKDLFTQNSLFDPESKNNCSIDPVNNQLFLWGLNMLPNDRVIQSLLQLVDIQSAFKCDKERIESQYPVNGKGDINIVRKTEAIVGAKREYIQKVTMQNGIIASELKGLFTFMTEGIAI